MCEGGSWPCGKTSRDWFAWLCRNHRKTCIWVLAPCKAWMKSWVRAVVWMPILWRAGAKTKSANHSREGAGVKVFRKLGCAAVEGCSAGVGMAHVLKDTKRA